MGLISIHVLTSVTTCEKLKLNISKQIFLITNLLKHHVEMVNIVHHLSVMGT